MTCNYLPRACMIVIPFVFASAFATDALRHDLFARPLTGAQTQLIRPDGTSPATPAATWSPKLTALMIAGKSSLANVEGTIIRIGESIDGHQLLFVREDEAVFVKGDEIVVVTMRGPDTTGSFKRGRK
jgi:hypothetical protein